MPPDVAALLVLCGTTAAGLAAWPLRRASARPRVASLVALGALCFALPLAFVRDASLGWRIAAGAGPPILALKLRDLHVGVAWWRAQPTGRWIVTILVPFVLVPRLHASAPPVPRSHALRRLAVGLLEVSIGLVLLDRARTVDWAAHGFAVEHVVRVLLLYLVAFDGGLAVLGALLALGGLARRPFTQDPILAATPAGFWRRYNLEAGRWFHADVFRPLRHRRGPVAATMGTFLVSGLLHEHLAAVLVGRVQGYQLAFFLVHGLAVVATARWRPRGPYRVLGIALTFAFVTITAVLFFASLENIAPGRLYRGGALLPTLLGRAPHTP